MLDVLLINPNYKEKLWKNTLSLYPPLGLSYLAAYLRTKLIKVAILEANAFELSEEETVKKTVESGAKIIGIGASTATTEIVFNLCKKIKEKDPSKIVVFGGVHATCLPKDSLENCPSIDYIVIGEGEKIFYNLVNALKNKKSVKKIKGVAFIYKKKFVQNPPEELIKNLDELPFPARDLLPIHLYRPGSEFDMGFRGKEYAEIISSRGCPNKCVFCSSAHFWKIIRIRSVNNIVEEIKELKKEGVKHITFVDDTITLSKSFILELCEKITPLKLKWDCYARVNNLTDDVVKAMKKSGCFAARIGYESGNNEILKKIKKNTNIEQAREATKILKKYGIRILGFFMIGLPGDTKETIEDTINFAIELSPDIFSFLITTPLPGTEMFEEYKAKGWISEKPIWRNMTLQTSEFTRTDELSAKDISEYYLQANRRLILRPKYWMQIILHFIKNPNELKIYFFRFIEKVKIEKRK